jgi:hypothetical protein
MSSVRVAFSLAAPGLANQMGDGLANLLEQLLQVSCQMEEKPLQGLRAARRL